MLSRDLPTRLLRDSCDLDLAVNGHLRWLDDLLADAQHAVGIAHRDDTIAEDRQAPARNRVDPVDLAATIVMVRHRVAQDTFSPDEENRTRQAHHPRITDDAVIPDIGPVRTSVRNLGGVVRSAVERKLARVGLWTEFRRASRRGA